MMATASCTANLADIGATLHGSRFGQFAASELSKGLDPYVPMLTGQLADSVVPRPFEVGYGARYAAPVYFENRRYNRALHPRATWKWLEAYKANDAQKLADSCARYLGGH